MKYRKFFWMFMLLVSPIVMAKNQIFYYEPKVVELTGIVKYLTFPGPPNYESIKKGDEDETCPYLILRTPIDVYPMSHAEAVGNDSEIKKMSAFLR